MTRPTMRFVPIKTDDQLDLQSLHRVRERWVVRRTAVINRIRGMLLERGITIRKGRHYIRCAISWFASKPGRNLKLRSVIVDGRSRRSREPVTGKCRIPFRPGVRYSNKG